MVINWVKMKLKKRKWRKSADRWIGILLCLVLVVGCGSEVWAIGWRDVPVIVGASGQEAGGERVSGAEGEEDVSEPEGGENVSETEGGENVSETERGEWVSETEGDEELAGGEAWEAEPLEELSLYAQAAVLLDASSGRVLYEKNGFTPMAMASTTKIMTCIVALESGVLGDEAEVSAYAASMPKVHLAVRKGEKYRIKDLLYSLMLESHNDSAVVIAEHVGKRYLEENLQKKSVAEYSVEESKSAVAAFADLMNRKARELGCVDTWFITPNGLDATETIHMPDGTDLVKEHTTTAAELAQIMAYCIGESPMKDTFLEITRTASYSFSANGRGFSCSNHNAFLNMMEGALSGKTGFTNKAGYCYVGALSQGEETYTVALLACGWPNHKTYKWSDTKELMTYGLEYFAYHQYSEAPIDEKQLKAVPVMDGCTDELGDTAYCALAAVGSAEGGLLLSENEAFTVKYTIEKSLQAPVNTGAQVGKIEYLLGDRVCVTIPVVTKTTVDVIDLKWCVEQIVKRYLING